MPFFIARASPAGRTAIVDHTEFTTRQAAEDTGRQRYPAEEFFIVEASYPSQAALQAVRVVDAQRPGVLLADDDPYLTGLR